jgi:hypothetical protein
VKQVIKLTGLILSILYAVIILWFYVRQPRSFAEITTQAAVDINVYSIKQENFDEAIREFNRGHFEVAIEQFKLADTAQRDAPTQFYIAYSYYLLGRGKFADDDDLFRLGLAAIERCLASAPNHIFEIDRQDLEIKNAGQLQARFQEGLQITPADFNPLNWFKKTR